MDPKQSLCFCCCFCQLALLFTLAFFRARHLAKIWYRLISKNSGTDPVIYRSVSKNSGIEPVIYRSVSKNSDIEPVLLLLHTVLLLGTVFYVKIRLNYTVSIEQNSGIDQYRTKPGIEPALYYIYIIYIYRERERERERGRERVRESMVSASNLANNTSMQSFIKPWPQSPVAPKES